MANLRLVRKLRVMLQDRVNNQLTVLLAELQAAEGAPQSVEEAEAAMSAARAVSNELETLSLESLKSWEARYARHLPSPLR